MNRWLRLAILCGAIPFILGIGIFLWWLSVRCPVLKFAGLVNIVFGVLAFIPGLLSLRLYTQEAADDPSIEHVRMKTMATGLLLFAIFPLAAYLIRETHLIESRQTVTIINDSGATLEPVTLRGGGVKIDFGQIKVGAKSTRSFHIATAGELTLDVRQGKRTASDIVEGYVAPGPPGGTTEIRIDRDGLYDVRHIGPTTGLHSDEVTVKMK